MRGRKILAWLLSASMAASVALTAFQLSVFAEAKTVYVDGNSGNDSGAGTREDPYCTIGQAYDNVANNGDIVLLSDITTDTLYIQNKTVTITSEGETPRSITCNQEINTMMYIQEKGALNLENITLGSNDSETADYGYVVYVRGGTLNLNRNATLQNFSGYGCIYASEATLNINSGSKIQNNETVQVPVYTIMSVTTLNGGTISGNSGGIYSSGIYAYGGTLNLISGSVINNTGTATGGIYAYRSTLNLISGSVINNTGTTTGGICAERSTVNVGGSTTPETALTITGNKASQSGTDSNLKLADSNMLNIQSGSLAPGSSIGVSTNSVPSDGKDVQFAANARETAAGFFNSDNQMTAGVLYRDNALYLSTSAAGYSVSLGTLPMGITSSGGALNQTGIGAKDTTFSNIILKAADGYKPLTEEQANTINAKLNETGLTAAWNDTDKTITISGTPNQKVDIKISDLISTSPEDVESQCEAYSGSYTSGDVTYGVIRFMFQFGDGTDDGITEYGIKYLKSEFGGVTPSKGDVYAKGNYSAFQGDIINIPNNDKTNYYAKAYIVRNGITYWSEVASSSVDWSVKLDYQPESTDGTSN